MFGVLWKYLRKVIIYMLSFFMNWIEFYSSHMYKSWLRKWYYLKNVSLFLKWPYVFYLYVLLWVVLTSICNILHIYMHNFYGPCVWNKIILSYLIISITFSVELHQVRVPTYIIGMPLIKKIHLQLQRNILMAECKT